MDTDKLIQFFTMKLKKIPELKNLSGYSDPTLVAWWSTIKATCERMGPTYKVRADVIDYSPSVVWYGNDNSDDIFREAYEEGLDEAEAFIRSLLEELETWGFNGTTASPSGKSKNADQDGKVILNLTISQQQIQEITQTINLSQYDEAVQEKVKELLAELKKPAKDKPKIMSTVKWLADKGSDALLAILLASTHLTSPPAS